MNTYGVVEASKETPLVMAAGDGVDATEELIWLLPASDDRELFDTSSLSLTASSANLAKSKRLPGIVCFRLRDDKDSSTKKTQNDQ